MSPACEVCIWTSHFYRIGRKETLVSISTLTREQEKTLELKRICGYFWWQVFLRV
jgi:hypothetical protein